MGAIVSMCFPSLFCTPLSSRGPALHFYAFGLDRGGQNRNPGIRHRGWLTGVNGTVVTGTVRLGELPPFLYAVRSFISGQDRVPLRGL